MKSDVSQLQLYLGDCLEVMATMEECSVDSIVTDPPYGISYSSNMRTVSPKFAVLNNDNNNQRFLSYGHFYRILKDDSVAIVFCSWKNMAYDFIELKKHFDIKNAIIWDKGGGGIGDLKHSLLTDYEIVLVCHKGKRKIVGKRDGSVWSHGKVNPSSMVHPTQKPIELMERLIKKFTNAGDIIVDPYMGSGSTGVACVNTNRNFVGIELDDNYFKIAEARIADAERTKASHLI